MRFLKFRKYFLNFKHVIPCFQDPQILKFKRTNSCFYAYYLLNWKVIFLFR